MEKAIEPWGVNVPFTIIALTYWALGSSTLFFDPSDHPYLMMIGAYSLYEGMFLRLFFPARKYLPLHLTSLVLMSVPLYPFQALSSTFLFLTELLGIRDVRSYGSKFPLNLLVLSSPIVSSLVWFLFPFTGYNTLVTGLLLYLLGVNVGIFSATMGLKAKFGIWQLPVFLLSFLSFLPKLLVFILVGYYVWLWVGTRKVRMELTPLLTLIGSLSVTASSLILGQGIHAFALGVMTPMFYSCITYSTSRYNYGRTTPIPVLLAVSYFLRFLNLEVSGILFVVVTLYFLLLIRHNMTITTLRLGMSAKYLRG